MKPHRGALSRKVGPATTLRSRFERAASAYLAIFFLAVTAAPHRHLNDLEDLLLDQRSDSGIIVQTVGSAIFEGLAFQPIWFARDIPCLACFTRDFVVAPTAAFVFVADVSPLPLIPSPPDVAKPELVLADAASRAPPCT